VESHQAISGQSSNPDDGQVGPDRFGGWTTAVACSLIAGIALAHELTSVSWKLWAGLGLLSALIALVWLIRHRKRSAKLWCCVSLCLSGAGWFAVNAGPMGQPPLAQIVPDLEESRLVRVRGVVEEQPRTIESNKGAFGRFSFQPPATLSQVRVDQYKLDGDWQPTSGKLLLHIREEDHSLKRSMRIEAVGWLRGFHPPANPGEFDFSKVMARRGVVGRLSLPDRGNWQEIDTAWWDLPWHVQHLRANISRACLESLREGMRDSGVSLGLMQTLLLGHWSTEMGDLSERFRGVGLAHVLSISGAHLGILMGLVWLFARLVFPNPPRAAMVVLTVLLMYVMALPMRPPIIRAAIMAGVFCVGYALGRRVSAMGLLSIAAMVVAIWRPGDVMTPGFQLSFAVVAGLLLWTRKVSRMLWAEPMIKPSHATFSTTTVRAIADYLAVSLIAMGVATPLVAWHYEMVTPLALVTSILALPVLIALLGVGYVKIVVGLVAGQIGGLLAGPLSWMAWIMIGLVEQASRWPGSGMELGSKPSWLWVIAALGVVAAICEGGFRKRRWQAVAAVVIAMLSLWWLTPSPHAGPRVIASSGVAPSSVNQTTSQSPAVRLTMLAVGDGSCYVIELPNQTWMFDCGSQVYLDVGERSIVPALKAMGIRKLDGIFLSHADLDHYSGVLDVIDAIPTRRVYTTPFLIQEAQTKLGSSTHFLVQSLRKRGLEPTLVTQGWSQSIKGVNLQVLWPHPEFKADRNNDTSIVLAIEAANKRILLNGDIQQLAKPALLTAHEQSQLSLDADITDLPHHGSFVDDSPQWFETVSPEVVLQSSAIARLRKDPWYEIIPLSAPNRHVTALHGAISVTVYQDGTIETRRLMPQRD